MGNKPVLYPYSAEEAKRRNKLPLWRSSHCANIDCKNAIDKAIRNHFDGMHLADGCINEIIAEFGYKRTAWVLSNTLQQKSWDGRFRPSNVKWAKQTYIPPDPRNTDFVAESHPAVLDGFVTMYRNAYQALGLFGPEHCEPDSFAELDYEGKVLVLSPDTLNESYWSPENQLWLAHDGFGCSPKAAGRSIRCTCLGDGEQTRWNRTDFVGVLQDQYLPAWAKEKLESLREQRQDMGGMHMT